MAKNKGKALKLGKNSWIKDSRKDYKFLKKFLFFEILDI